jgi:hypothetical protein
MQAYNKHNSGAAWHYWYNFPTSYDVWSAGNDLKQSTRIFEWLLERSAKDSPVFFFQEMLGYVYTMQGDAALGKEYYEKALAKAPKESGNYKRSVVMLGRIQ